MRQAEGNQWLVVAAAGNHQLLVAVAVAAAGGHIAKWRRPHYEVLSGDNTLPMRRCSQLALLQDSRL